MAGIAWRTELYDLLDQAFNEGLSSEIESKLQHCAEETSHEFNAARQFDSRSEYNYISQIQMVVRVVGVVARLKGFDQNTAQFLINPGNLWYRELVDEAENLFSELSLVRSGEEPSRYYQEARAHLDRLYGDDSKAIEGFTNILDRGDVYRPPVRRAIIRAYLSRRRHDWSQLTKQELVRVSQLARENLEEEPDSHRNLSLWLQAVRRTGEVSIELTAERLGYMRLNSLPSKRFTIFTS